MEETKTLEVLKQDVLVREKDLAEVFNRWSSLVASLEGASESKHWEILGRIRTIEAVLFSAVAKLVNSYREYSKALEEEIRR